MTIPNLQGGKEVELMATAKQCSLIVMLMSQLFGGEIGRKKMLLYYFGKKSTKEFDFDEAKIVIELLLNQREPLLEFYNNLIYDDHSTT